MFWSLPNEIYTPEVSVASQSRQLTTVRPIQQRLGLAGSRRQSVLKHISSGLVDFFLKTGCGFIVDAVCGVAASFRTVLAEHAVYRTTVICPSFSRVRLARHLGFRTMPLNNTGMALITALHRRSVALVAESSILVLFPDDPATGTWDVSSVLAFNIAVQLHKPAFVVTNAPPLNSDQTFVVPASLFSLVGGYWTVPRGVAVSKDLVISA